MSNVWKEFIDYHTSREFLEKVFNVFDRVSCDAKIKLPNIVLEENEDCNAFTDFSFVKHPPINDVSNKIPHSDNEKEIYAGLLYLKYPEDKSTGGDFCIHEQKNNVMNFRREYYTPGKIIKKKGKLFKVFRGMGSVGAMNKGSADRYFQKKQKDKSKYVPEGVEGLIKYKGDVSKTINKLVGGLRSSMGYLGAEQIKYLNKKAKFVKITKAGFYESMVHNVDIVKMDTKY